MKLKLSLVLCVIVFYASSIFAQNTVNGKTRFALLGGVNFQNINGKDVMGQKMENKLIVGYHIGFTALIPLVPEFYFQPGVLFSTKGAKSKNDSISSKYKISYIEIPLNFVYRSEVGNGYVMLGFGPYFGYGIAGKVITDYKTITTTNDIKFKNSVETTDPQNVPYMKALDVGGNIFVGYEMKGGIFFQLNSQIGMVKINSENKRIPNDKSAWKNTGFGLSLGYRF